MQLSIGDERFGGSQPVRVRGMSAVLDIHPKSLLCTVPHRAKCLCSHSQIQHVRSATLEYSQDSDTTAGNRHPSETSPDSEARGVRGNGSKAEGTEGYMFQGITVLL